MIYFLIYLALEVFVSVNISSAIGAFATFLEIIFSAIVGFILLANFRNTFADSMIALQKRSISFEEFQRLNTFSLLGAILLIIPGFFTDIVGILLQFTFFATIFARKVLHVEDSIDIEDVYEHKNRKDNDEIIDVEIIDHKPNR